MSALLTRDMAEAAVDLELPKIHELIASGMAGRGQLHIVMARRLYVPGAHGMFYDVIYERSIGVDHRRKFEGPFVEVAHGKAQITGRTGLPARVVHTLRQDLLVPGDVQYWGSWIEGDIIVAPSGFRARVDENVAKGVVNNCQTLIEELIENDREVMERDRRDGPPDDPRFRLLPPTT